MHPGKLPGVPLHFLHNASTDILTIFTDALDILGIGWTQTTSRVVSVARSSDVLLIDAFVGPKA
ncbi:MAG: hypothetical protein WBM90_05595 [Acidimicrobiia bacterium]